MIFEDVLRLRPEEPQSYRDLALVLATRRTTRAHATTLSRGHEPVGAV